MNSALVSFILHYKTRKGTEGESAGIPVNSNRSYFVETMGKGALTEMELQEHRGRIVSHGCSVNIQNRQLYWTKRLSRFGFLAPHVTTLETEGWIFGDDPEPMRVMQKRLVAEVSRRINLQPVEIDVPSLMRIFKVDIPLKDTARDRQRPYFREPDDDPLMEELRIAAMRSWSTTELGRAWLAKSMKNDYTSDNTDQINPTASSPPSAPDSSASAGQRESNSHRTLPIASAPLSPSTALTETKELKEHDEVFSPPPKRIVEQTIQWSTSTDYLFTPKLVGRRRPTVVSPRELRDEDYLGFPMS